MRTILCFLSALYALTVPAQITRVLNAPRAGDVLVKQQTDHKDPGRSGENVVWDFGNLRPVNDRYTVKYTEPQAAGDSAYIMGKNRFGVKEIEKGELIIGTEHNTMYYYRLKDERLLLLGHENPVTLLRYATPLPAGVFPFAYGETYRSEYKTEGSYSAKMNFASNGQSETAADAYGMMVLPSGDTLKHVLRTRTVQVFTEEIEKSSGTVILRDSKTETFKWYAKGYRYPVFETVRTFMKQNTDTAFVEKFSTAFFFPPQDHFYLDNDPDNLAVQDSLHNEEYRQNDMSGQNGNDVPARLSYNFYPNPVETVLTVEYFMEQASAVTVSLYASDGRSVKSVSIPSRIGGLYSEAIDCSGLTKGIYILKIQVGSTVVTDKVIKK